MIKQNTISYNRKQTCASSVAFSDIAGISFSGNVSDWSIIVKNPLPFFDVGVHVCYRFIALIKKVRILFFL